jgi:dTDP-glucose pyrophosphorylase
MEIALVFMAAGLSSRFGGRIKGFAKVGPNNQSLIEYSIDQAMKSSFSQIIFIVSEGTEMQFRTHFGSEYQGLKITYVLQSFDKSQRKKPWGTGDAVVALKGHINCPFVLCNADDIYGETAFKLLVDHVKMDPRRDQNCATVGYPIIATLPESNKGVNRGLLKAEDGYVSSIVETFNISSLNLIELGLSEKSLCCTNLFVFYPKVIDLLEIGLDDFKIKNDSNGEYLLPSQICELIANGQIKMKLCATTDQWYGVTYPEDENKLRLKLSDH